MNTTEATPVTAPAPHAEPTPLRRGELRRAVDAVCPDNCIWIAADELAHPEAERASGELPLPLAVGRVRRDGRMRGVREADLVVEALLRTGRTMQQVAGDLVDYGRFVVATAPTQHARLTGRTLDAYLVTRSFGR